MARLTIANLWAVAAALALSQVACGGGVLQRKVVFPNDPTVAVGPNRLRTVELGAVTFTPAPASGSGDERWPAETVAVVERRLRTDLAAQKWLGVPTDANGELKLELACTYTAELAKPSPWLWSPLAAGLATAGVGGLMFLGEETRATASTLVIVGTVVAMLGGFGVAKAVGPPAVREETLACVSGVVDTMGREVYRGEHHHRAAGAKKVADFLAAGERAMFGELSDGIDQGLQRLAADAASGTSLGSIAILDFEATMLDDRQRAMITKVAATELQNLRVGTVIGVDDVRAILGLERLKQLVGCNEDSCIAELGGALGVERLVAGSVSRVGTGVVAELRLMNVGSMTVERRVTVSLHSVAQVVAQMPALVRQLVRP